MIHTFAIILDDNPSKSITA